MKAEKLINWSALSEYLTKNSNKTAIRSNNIPIKYKENINTLLKHINNWIEGEELHTKKEYFNELEENIEIFKESMKS